MWNLLTQSLFKNEGEKKRSGFERLYMNIVNAIPLPLLGCSLLSFGVNAIFKLELEKKNTPLFLGKTFLFFRKKITVFQMKEI